jgi:tRNA(fMet)-specific endonuclease VapC
LAKYTLDTDIVIELLRGNRKILDKITSLNKDSVISISGLTVYELYKGIYFIGNKKEREDTEGFIKNIEVLHINLNIEKKAAKIYVDLRKKGKISNDADLLIAATVMVEKSILVTNNTEHFKRISGLMFENWMHSTS